MKNESQDYHYLTVEPDTTLISLIVMKINKNKNMAALILCKCSYVLLVLIMLGVKKTVCLILKLLFSAPHH